MSEIEDLKAQMAAMMAMMNKQQALHEQEIKDLQGRYGRPAADPPDSRRTSESSNPKHTTAAKARSTSGFSKCNNTSWLPASKTTNKRYTWQPTSLEGMQPPGGATTSRK